MRCLPIAAATAKLGDGDDTASVVDPRPLPVMYAPARPPELRIEAGPGTDQVTRGPRSDALVDSGDGEADEFGGGGGHDSLTYASRTRGVTVTLGRSGEDTVEDIEELEGGAGPDVIVGDERANRLTGGPGRDRLEGRGGPDELHGTDGSDRLFGGPGDDGLTGDSFKRSPDHLDGGPGDDRFDLALRRFEVFSVAGPETVRLSDGRRDVVVCGSGRDVLERRGPEDDRTRNCETTKLPAGGASMSTCDARRAGRFACASAAWKPIPTTSHRCGWY